MSKISKEDAVVFLHASYRDWIKRAVETKEDSAYWSAMKNAGICMKIVDLVGSLDETV